MLYYKFRNFEEFKELFGMQQHGNGVKSRKNKILLAYIKNPQLLHDATSSGDYRLLHISSMAELRNQITTRIIRSGEEDNLPYEVQIKDMVYRSKDYYTDDYQGMCEDGDYRSFRYVSAENSRVFKMKMGKFYRKLILDTSFGQTLPEQVINYLCEEVSQDWQTFVMGRMPKSRRLFVNRDFAYIYDSDYQEGDFDSCMNDKDNHYFYENAVDASAAYLENDDGMIISRCVIFNKATDQNGKIWRLAERQYSSDGNDVLKRTLVDALIQEGYIDGYKTVGAGCSDARSYVDNEGNSLSDHRFCISCDLDYGDTLSYQDSFKHYDIGTRIATNYGDGYLNLDTTEGELEDDDRSYDDFHDRYCNDVATVYYRGREYSCDTNDMGDFIWVNEEDGYYHYEDVSTCDQCGGHYLSDNGCYSDLTEGDYCCSSCLEKEEDRYKEENWSYSEYDSEYFEDSDDVVEYMTWWAHCGRYEQSTISRDTLSQKLEDGDFYEVDGVFYDDINTETSLPHGMIPLTNNEGRSRAAA